MFFKNALPKANHARITQHKTLKIPCLSPGPLHRKPQEDLGETQEGLGDTHLMDSCLPAEVGNRVSTSKELAKAGVRWEQPLSRQNPRKLLVGYYELVARVEVLLGVGRVRVVRERGRK